MCVREDEVINYVSSYLLRDTRWGKNAHSRGYEFSCPVCMNPPATVNEITGGI